MSLSIEELLKPRYKVIAPDTSENFKPGDIFTKENKYWFITNDNFELRETELEKYPHLFRRLEWHEEIDKKDMPQYLKVNTEKTSLFFGNIHKVRGLHLFPDPETLDITASKYYVLLEGISILYRFNLSHFLPATKEEYENQKQ